MRVLGHEHVRNCGSVVRVVRLVVGAELTRQDIVIIIIIVLPVGNHFGGGACMLRRRILQCRLQLALLMHNYAVLLCGRVLQFVAHTVTAASRRNLVGAVNVRQVPVADALIGAGRHYEVAVAAVPERAE